MSDPVSPSSGLPASGPAWRRWMPVAILAALMLAGYLAGGHKLLMLEKIVDLRDSFKSLIGSNPLLAGAVFVLVYAALVSLSVPGASIGTLAGGLMFGWFWGGLASVVAATIGATVVFLVARSAIGETLAKRAGPQVERLQAGFKDNALSYLLFLRLVPVFPFFIVNIVPALLGVPLRTYFFGTLIGILPGGLAFASIGAGLDSVVAAAKAGQAACRAAAAGANCPLMVNLSTLITPEVKIAFGLLGLLALIPVALKTWSRHHGRAHA